MPVLPATPDSKKSRKYILRILCFYNSLKFTFFLKNLVFKICIKFKPRRSYAKHRSLVCTREKEGIGQGLPYDPSPLNIRWNIQDMCHTCVIYITLSVDTYIDTFAVVWWIVELLKENCLYGILCV